MPIPPGLGELLPPELPFCDGGGDGAGGGGGDGGGGGGGGLTRLS